MICGTNDFEDKTMNHNTGNVCIANESAMTLNL